MAEKRDFRKPARAKITVRDEEIVEFYPYLTYAKAELNRNGASVCTLIFDSLRSENGSWIIQDSGVFEPWSKFKIEADFGEYSEEIMRGYVISLQVDNREHMGESQVVITCQDETLVLDRKHEQKTWSREDEPMSDGEIAREIAQEYGLNADVEDGLINLSLNQNSTPIQLLRQRAEANGFELYIRQAKLVLKPPQVDQDPQPAIMVYSGERTNCINISVNHDGHRPDNVTMVRAPNIGTQSEVVKLQSNLPLLGKKAVSSENSGQVPFTWQLSQPMGSSLEEATSRAQAKANENAWKITAKGELDGSLYGHVLLTHKPVGVYGIGETYGGVYYVDQVAHIFNQEGYKQTFQLLRNATGLNSEPQISDSLAAVR